MRRINKNADHTKIFIPIETKQFIIDYINATFRMGYCDATYECKYDIIGVTANEEYAIKNI